MSEWHPATRGLHSPVFEHPCCGGRNVLMNVPNPRVRPGTLQRRDNEQERGLPQLLSGVVCPVSEVSDR